MSNCLPFEILAPGPTAEPSGVRNSQSILCVAARPLLTLQSVEGDASNYFVTLSAPNPPRLRCMGFHYVGGSRPSADFKQKKTQPVKVGFLFYLKPDDDLLSHGNSQTTIGDTSFHV